MACATVVGRQPDERIARRGEGGQDGPRAPKNVAQAVKRAQRGDRQALAFLYACYADDIYGYVRSIVHDHHEAEDVTQQVFAKLIGVIGSYKEREVPFFAWILRVARNAAIDHIRKRRLVPVEEVRAVAATATEQRVSRRVDDLKDALATLPHAQRDGHRSRPTDSSGGRTANRATRPSAGVGETGRTSRFSPARPYSTAAIQHAVE